MDQHFLTSYHHAILSIILAQFSPKGFLDGMEGIVRLVKDSPYLQVCSVLFRLTVLHADTIASQAATLPVMLEHAMLCSGCWLALLMEA